MNIRTIEYFVETVKYENFTKAANSLYVSQPALSKAIQNLEIELNVILIDRNAKEFKLTAEGEKVYAYGKEVLDFFREKTEDLLAELHKKNRELKLGITPTSGAMFFFSVIYQFRQQYPMSLLKIVEVSTKEGIDMLLEGKLDMSVVIDPFEDDRLDKLCVVASEAVLLVPVDHRLAERQTVSFAEIADEPLLMVGKEYMYAAVVDEKFKEANITPNYTFQSGQWEFVFEMVANGQGISILPKPLVDKFNNARVKQIRLENPRFDWNLSLIRKKNKACHHAALDSFWSLCESEKLTLRME